MFQSHIQGGHIGFDHFWGGIYLFTLSCILFLDNKEMRKQGSILRTQRPKMKPPFSEDAQLVLKCLAGDADSFGVLVRRYQNAAFATALTFVRNRPDAQDIVQEAFIAAYCKMRQLREPIAFAGWLRRIVVNCCKEHLRKRQFLQTHIFSLDAAAGALARLAEAEYDNHEEKVALWDAVDSLPESYRSVALMYYFSGLSYEEMATFLEVPISTIRGRLQKARVRLREALSLPEREEVEMSQIDVAKEVQAVVCRIATEPIQERIPLGDTDHIVLFCGIDADIEIREAEGEDVILEGTKASIGLSEEVARASMEKIQILADRVDSFLEVGPHPGEVFTGTDRDKEGKIIGSQSNTQDMWMWYAHEGLWAFTDPLSAANVYPFLKDHIDRLPGEVQAVLGRATRITIFKAKMEDIILPTQAYTRDVRKVFRPNYTSQDEVHGSIGYVNLVVGVPPSKTVTIIRGRSLRASGLRASLYLMAIQGAELSDIQGDVYLFDSSFKSAKSIQGSFRQRFYRYGGAHWTDYRIRRGEKWDGEIEDVKGEVDIDVGRGQIEATNLSGRVRIYNRYGTTRLYQSHFDPGSQFRLESCSGEILLFLKEELISQVNMTASSLCGTVSFDPLKTLGALNQRNDQYLMVMSTMTSSRGKPSRNVLEADIYLKTESGDVTIEKMK